MAFGRACLGGSRPDFRVMHLASQICGQPIRSLTSTATSSDVTPNQFAIGRWRRKAANPTRANAPQHQRAALCDASGFIVSLNQVPGQAGQTFHRVLCWLASQVSGDSRQRRHDEQAKVVAFDVFVRLPEAGGEDDQCEGGSQRGEVVQAETEMSVFINQIQFERFRRKKRAGSPRLKVVRFTPALSLSMALHGSQSPAATLVQEFIW